MALLDDNSSVSDEASLNVYLPIDFTGCEKVRCVMCGCAATAPSPLTCNTQASGGKRPWAKYRLIYADARVSPTGEITVNAVVERKPVARKPTSKACAICRNVFNALGLEERHRTIPQFYTFCCRAENAGEFRAFISCMHEWVILHNNSDDGSVRLKNSKELNQRFTQLKALKTREAGFENHDMEFVTKDAWDAKLDGEWDQNKAVTHEIFGQMREDKDAISAPLSFKAYYY